MAANSWRNLSTAASFTTACGKTDDAVGVCELPKPAASFHPFTHFGGHSKIQILLGRPAIPKQARESDLKDRRIHPDWTVCCPLGVLVPHHAAARVAVEDPLRWIIGIGARKTVRIGLVGYGGPVIEIERNFARVALVTLSF